MSFVEISAVLGNLGEFIGSLAVLATLIYLAVQVGHSRVLLEENRKIALSQVYQTRSGYLIDAFAAQTDPDLAAVLNKVALMSDLALPERLLRFESLSGVEQIQVRAFAGMYVQSVDNTLFQVALGLIAESQLDNTRALVRSDYEFWRQIGVPMTPAITAFHEQLLAAQR